MAQGDPMFKETFKQTMDYEDRNEMKGQDLLHDPCGNGDPLLTAFLKYQAAVDSVRHMAHGDPLFQEALKQTAWQEDAEMMGFNAAVEDEDRGETKEQDLLHDPTGKGDPLLTAFLKYHAMESIRHSEKQWSCSFWSTLKDC